MRCLSLEGKLLHNREWHTALRDIETGLRPIGEQDVLRDLQRARVQLEETGGLVDEELVAEITAYAVREENAGQLSEWGVRFGPRLATSDENGVVTEWPRRTSITSAVIEYWKKRAEESPHPVLRGRYARLAWDLAHMVPNVQPDYQMAHVAIDSAIEATHGNLVGNEIHGIQVLKTSLRLAHQLNDTSRIEAVRDELIRYEGQIAIDEKAGLWGFSFDFLVQEKLGNATQDQIKDLVAGLESRLERLTGPNRETIDPWTVMAAVQRLALFYRGTGDEKKLQRVLRTLADTIERVASKAEPMQACALMEQSHGIMQSFGLTDEAEEIAVKLRKLGPIVRDSLQAITLETEIETAEVEEAVDSVLDHTPEEALERLAVNFIPLKDRVEQQVRNYAEDYPLGGLFPVNIVDFLGRTVSQVGSVEEDIDGRIVHQMGQNLQFMAFLLRAVLAEAARRGLLDPPKLVNYLYRSPVFRPEFRGIIEHGLARYAEGDVTSAVHVLVPQIEGAIRHLLEEAQRPVLKPVRGGKGFDVRVLDNLLRDPATSIILTENLTLYLRVVFADRRGWNIRNRVCHALMPTGEVSIAIADRVVHALLCLALVKKREAA